MVAWGSVARTAIKVAPVAMTVARQLDRQLRPHVLAYRLARDVDGYVGRWTSDEGNHYVVFARRDAMVLRVFPPVPGPEIDVIEDELDRASLRHHREMAEAKVRDTTARVVGGPSNLTNRRGRGDDPGGDASRDRSRRPDDPPALPGRGSQPPSPDDRLG